MKSDYTTTFKCRICKRTLTISVSKQAYVFGMAGVCSRGCLNAYKAEIAAGRGERVRKFLEKQKEKT